MPPFRISRVVSDDGQRVVEDQHGHEVYRSLGPIPGICTMTGSHFTISDIRRTHWHPTQDFIVVNAVTRSGRRVR